MGLDELFEVCDHDLKDNKKSDNKNKYDKGLDKQGSIQDIFMSLI